ncbi:MAG TPA: MBL fold metallo-hydrolase [Geminicoccaceae bacterium]|nr:MBL fold metallo-hydrolase [Geminicoccaceae bacterium]
MAPTAAAAAFGMAATALANCFPIAQLPDAAQAGVQPIALRPAPPARGEVRLTFLGHSSFLIETPAGVTAITDYNGAVRAAFAPDIVTMNNAHSTHYTDFVEPGVKHVLRGWGPAGGVAAHDVTEGDLRVRNVPTNVRESGGTRYNGNSIFVFEVADLCIAHLGHLHHTLTDVHLGELGQIDVLLVPADGAYTMAQELMVEVVGQIAPTLVVPMHYFSSSTLARFLELIEDSYEPIYSDTPTVTLTSLKLPYHKVLVLPGG